MNNHAYTVKNATSDYVELINPWDDKDVLKKLGKLLGQTDVEGQISEIEVTENFLDMQIEKAEEERKKNQKLYKTLGIVTGLVLVIILL